MKQIKVTYRAVFAQPIGALNPMSLKLPGPFPVEVFGSGEKWQARELVSPKRQVYEKLSKFASAAHGQSVVADSFAQQLQPWQIWGIPPIDDWARKEQQKPQERMMEPSEIQVLPDGRVLMKEVDDYTHILHAPTHDPKDKGMPPAACGQKVHVKAFINNKANLEPTCKACAQVWRDNYQEKSA